MIVLSSCSKIGTEQSDTNEYPKLLCNFLKSNDFLTLKSTYPSLAKGLDLNNFNQSQEKGVTFYSLQSAINEKILGNILFTTTETGSFVTIIELFTRNEIGDIISFNYNSVYGETAFLLNCDKIDEQTFSLKLDKNSLYLTLKRSWWTCVRECVGDAWGACADDPECDFVCTIIGPSCAGSVAIACAAWCADDTDNELIPN
ncbi:MAG: hypothetical protein KKG99_01245 [Bacteroidetes bacterium]|nr:hypothetical protein [Bacteroidota bacterium]